MVRPEVRRMGWRGNFEKTHAPGTCPASAGASSVRARREPFVSTGESPKLQDWNRPRTMRGNAEQRTALIAWPRYQPRRPAATDGVLAGTRWPERQRSELPGVSVASTVASATSAKAAFASRVERESMRPRARASGIVRVTGSGALAGTASAHPAARTRSCGSVAGRSMRQRHETSPGP